MSFTKTVSEFSSTRKIKYGDGSRRAQPSENSGVSGLRSPLRCGEEGLSPHTAVYSKDANGNPVYVVEFNIGSFQFDELIIKTESQKLYVNGKTKTVEETDDEVSRTFKREFKLPSDCDENTIKAELDEKTRQLKLVGTVIPQRAEQNSSFSSYSTDKFGQDSYQTFSSAAANQEIGTVKESKHGDHLEYEIYLGNELKEGQVIFEVPNKTTLNIRIIKSSSDNNGSYNFELKREIKLPQGAKLNNIDHGVDSRTKALLIKVPVA